MKPKENAEYLVDKYLNEMPKYLQGNLGRKTSKQCALICVDEFIEALDFNSSPTAEGLTEYYTEVKQEINKL